MNFKKIASLGVLALSLALTATVLPRYIHASDHDDGEVDTKGRNLNLTDLYVFRERDQNTAVNTDDLILIMNTNPRSLARQQYYFSTNAAYDFHITRVSNKDATPTGVPNLTVRFRFGAPNSLGQQSLGVSLVRNGVVTDVTRTSSGTPILTTSLGSATSPVLNQISLGGFNLTVFAGLREDPFFFDVEQFFRVRAGLLNAAGFINLPLSPVVGFRSPSTAIDFTKGYNVNSIAIRIPRALLQEGTETTTFDVWQTISVKQPDNTYKQFERLARPAINEGLIYTNAFLNAFNKIPPNQDLSDAAAPVRAEAIKTLKALGNTDAQAAAKAGAFLPDVMRIDTTGPSGYGNALNALGSPIRGRMLKDDVVDITLSVLTQGTPNAAVNTDNVSYEGVTGNPGQGHKPLETSFPYLALPN